MAMRSRPRALWIALIVAAPVLLGGGFVTYLLLTLPDVDYLVRDNPSETALMAARGGERTQLWAPLADISPRLVEAVLMGEDVGFYSHDGFDTREISVQTELERRSDRPGREHDYSAAREKPLPLHRTHLCAQAQRSHPHVPSREGALEEPDSRDLPERHRVGRRCLRRRGGRARCVRDVSHMAGCSGSRNARRDDPEPTRARPVRAAKVGSR